MNEHSQEKKDQGKIQPIKLTPEQLEKRREEGYKTDEESRRTPSSTMGKDAVPEEDGNADTGKE
ncbi:MAG TPA: hypothetical protein VLC28_03515 [Flavitalea sp.]|nr:hypothetical protein [Flavitalea sp.]